MNNIYKNLTFEESGMSDSQKKLLYLHDIVIESKVLINLGFEYLLKDNFRNATAWPYLIFMLCFSRGFELLMKAIICYKTYEKNHDNEDEKTHFPTKGLFKNFRHNLSKLKEEIIKNYNGIEQRKNDTNRRLIEELIKDRNFLSKDKDLSSLLDFISKYAEQGRYYELNMITESDQNAYDVKNEFLKIVFDFIHKDKILFDKFENSENYYPEEMHNQRDDIWLKSIKENIFPILKKFLKVLYRQFNYGLLGEEAMEVSGDLDIDFTS